MNKINRRSPFAIVGRLIVLVKPMLPVMLAAIVMGVAGHFCATFITIFGGFGILRALGLASPVRTVGTAFACILVFALLRGVLRYAEQASNHYIAFKLLALIRDKVFGALRRLTPAKLEGRDRGDLISLITADIEALEVFYAHTISPICIACICVIGMTGFVGSWHILPALVLLAGYLLVGVALPVWSAKRGDHVAREYRQALADTNSYVLESLRGLKDTLQYQDTAARAEGITAHSEMLGEKQKAMKYREGLTVAITNTIFDGYDEWRGDLPARSTGSLISYETGVAVAYGLFNAQQRGTLIVDPGDKVYEGMVVGYSPAGEDITVNVCKTKHLSNTRASGSDDALRLVPVSKFSLEESLEFLKPDELLEVTPSSIRIRKRILNHDLRMKATKGGKNIG